MNKISKIIIFKYLYELLHYFVNEISIFFIYVIIFCCFPIVLNFYFEYYIFLNNFMFSLITINLLKNLRNKNNLFLFIILITKSFVKKYFNSISHLYN